VFQDRANLCTERLYGRGHATQLNPLDNGHLQLETLGCQSLLLLSQLTALSLELLEIDHTRQVGFQ